MTHKKIKKYGRTLPKTKYTQQQIEYLRREMNIPKEVQKKYPNIFEVEEE